MVSNILENFQTHTGVGVKSPYNLPPVKKETNSVTNLQNSDVSKNVNNQNKEKYILPLGLIAGGGLLLYYGVKHPGNVNMFKKHVQNRLIQMEIEINSFETGAKRVIKDYSSAISGYIRNYKQNNNIIPTEFSSNIKRLNTSKQVVNAQDLAFEAIANTEDEHCRAGLPDEGLFRVKFEDLKREAVSQIERKQESTRLLFEDLAHLPRFASGKYSDLVENSESQLITTASVHLEELQDIKLGLVRKFTTDSYREMADFILKNRGLRNEAKVQVIENSFEQVRNLLKLSEDFKPSYDKIPTLDNFSKLTPEDLKPQAKLSDLDGHLTYNVYFEALKNMDFNKITKKDLTQIFYSSPYNNNLKDLGFLIDRLRLRKVVSAQETSDNNKMYDVAIAKLEFLRNKLTSFGKNELIKKCSYDFENMNVEQRRAKLYYISTVSRRLGFDSFEDMDKYMSKNSSIYNALNIREYIDIIKSAPELYFM